MREERAAGLSTFFVVLTAICWIILSLGAEPASGASGQAGCCVVKGQCFFPETQTQCNNRAIPNKWDGCRKCNDAGTDCGEKVDPTEQTFCYCVSADGKILRFAEQASECKGKEVFKCIKQKDLPKPKLAQIISLESCPVGGDCSLCKVDVCSVVEVTPSSIVIEARDNQGLAVISILESQNADTIVPPFTTGTTESVFVRSTKIDPTLRSRVSLLVIDTGCPCAAARICDPVLTSVLRVAGKPISESYSELPQEEDSVTIFNSRRGLNHLDIIVNGVQFKVKELTDNEERTIDVSSAMFPGNANIITLKTHGKPGTSATVLIWGRHSRPLGRERTIE